jgi:hypothetical protein
MSQAIYPISNWKTVTPSDTDKFAFANMVKRCRAIIVGGSGDVVVRNEDGTTTAIPVVAGGQYAVSTDQILATGTSATPIVAGFDSQLNS